MSAAPIAPIQRLLQLLRLDPLDRDLFIGETPAGKGRLFGGLVAAQAVSAATRTVAEGSLHSLHAYFLRPGRHGTPIRFLVHRIRDGRSYTTRRVVAYQGGEAIFNLSSSFARPEEGISHQDAAPKAPGPESLPDWEDLRAEMLGDPSLRRKDGPLEVRMVDPPTPGAHEPARSRVWLRTRGALPDDPALQAALLVYATDRTLLSTAARPHGLTWGRRIVASLDHAVWIHRPPRMDAWTLYSSSSPAAHSARGLVLGAMYDQHGLRIASVAQEGLIRIPRPREEE